MSREIRESDWRLFRELHPIALNRFCDRVLSEIAAVISDATKTPHARYGDIFTLIRERDRQIARAFDDKRRSTALLQLAIIHSFGLLTEEELDRFSPEAQEAITWHERI